MATDDAATLVFPIGHCFGTYYESPDPDGHHQRVRVGPDVVRLSDEQFTLWSLAHSAPDRPLDQPWNCRSVLDLARTVGLVGAEEVLDGLVADSMVATVTPGTDDAVLFARRYRMVPTMLGLGNSAAEPGLYSVGLPGQPIVQMASLVYDLYEWSHLDPSLWAACNGAAETSRRVEITDPTATDPARLLDALLLCLHTLLGPNSVYLDTRLAS